MKIKIVRPTTKLSAIRFEQAKSHQIMFPVVDESVLYMGIIWVRDLDRFQDDRTAQDMLDYRRNDWYSSIRVYDSQPLTYAKTLISQNQLPFLPVIDQNNKYIGTVNSSS